MFLDSKIIQNIFREKNLFRRVAHIGSKVRTNPPSFAKFRFFSCSLYERALSSHDVSAAQTKMKEIWSNGTSTVNVRVHDSRAVGVGTTSTEVWSTTAFLFSCSARRPTAGVQKKKNALDGISIFHPPRSLSAQCVTRASPAKARWNERRNPTWTDKPSSFLSVLVEGEAAINPSQTLLLLVHLSRFKSLRPRKSGQGVRSKKNNALEVNLWLHPVPFPGSTSGALEHGGFCVPCALFHRSCGQDVGQLITKPMSNWNWFMSQVVLKEGTAWC